MPEANPLERINHNSNLDTILTDACAAYQLTNLAGESVITVGYEDCNVVIDTDQGRFLAKLFSKERSLVDIKRYTNIVSRVVEAGVNHPKPLLNNDGKMVYRRSGVSLMIQEYIEGATFYEHHRDPNDSELDLITEQAAKINNIDYRPPFYEDSWAVLSINKMFEKVQPAVEPDDRQLLQKAVAIYNKIPVDRLPHAFVHGDMISTNVIKGRDGKVHIIDFSVANYYPRIQELAVMATSLLQNSSLKQRCERILESYEKFAPLQSIEKKYLFDYAIAAAAMEVIGACDEKYFKRNSSSENDHWLNSGRSTLLEALGS